jgi:hypothetical protein
MNHGIQRAERTPVRHRPTPKRSRRARTLSREPP